MLQNICYGLVFYRLLQLYVLMPVFIERVITLIGLWKFAYQIIWIENLGNESRNVALLLRQVSLPIISFFTGPFSWFSWVMRSLCCYWYSLLYLKVVSSSILFTLDLFLLFGGYFHTLYPFVPKFFVRNSTRQRYHFVCFNRWLIFTFFFFNT